MATSSSHQRSVPELFTDLVGQATGLVRTEARLARAELSEKMGQAVGGLAMIVIGAVLLIPALTILFGAAVTALMNAGIAAHWSAVIVGGAALAIGAVFLIVGLSRIKAERLMPTRTMEQLQRDAAVAKQQVRQADDEIQRAA